MRQCSLISACIMHSAEQARHIMIVVCIIDVMTCMSQPFMRSIMRIMVSQTSAQFAHIPAHRPMPSPASASAHITHACMHAERASIHSCIIDMSMPDMTYTIIKVGDEGTGGGILKNPMPGAPSMWVPYVLVDDVKAATKKAQSLGAKVTKDFSEVPNMGYFSIITDPTGGMLGLWETKK